MKPKKGELTRIVLENLSDIALDSLSLFGSIAVSGYGASYSRMEWNKRRIKEGLSSSSSDIISDDIRRKKRNFSSLISKLKSDGLISVSDNKLRITSRGIKRLKELKNNLSAKTYLKEEDNDTKIFMFDIPEQYKYKRNQLRKVLIELGFKPIQKSVFIGKIKIPEELLNDLRELDMIDFIDILSVTKTGSVVQIK